MNTCHFDAALLDAYTEGDLFLDDMIQVQKHLDMCPDCQAYVEDLLAIRAAFPKVEDTVVPPDFTANVMAAVAANPRVVVSESPVETPVKTSKKKAPWLRVLAPLAACCAIVIAVQGMGGNKAMDAMVMDVATGETTAETVSYAAQDSKAEEIDDAATEETIPEEETVSQDILNDSSRTEPAQESVDAATTGSETAPAPTAGEKALYRVCVTLDAASAGDLLDTYTPVTDVMSKDMNSGTETRELRYELTMEQYTALLDQLGEQGMMPAEEVFETDSETVLVIVQQDI